jgi:8-oxo-dGTP diphosphatase
MLGHVKLPIVKGAWAIAKEVGRHVLRRPVVGVVAAAQTEDGRWLLIRRADTGKWALVGGTLEWNETLAGALTRELMEEAGVKPLSRGRLCGAYSDPERDFRFHAVTVVIHITVSEPERSPMNPLEIREVGLFRDDELPAEFSHRMRDMLDNVRSGRVYWE